MSTSGLSPATRRLIKLQRQIHKTVRADVRRALGAQSRDIKRYYEAYKREFRGPARRSSKEDLLKACLAADVTLIGDYHTFAQSQKTALKLARETAENVSRPHGLALGLEMLPSSAQPEIDAYMTDAIDEQEFLKRVDYSARWGFPWPNFKPFFLFARAQAVRVIGLNCASDDLHERDAHAAGLIANFSAANPKSKLFVLYGDLHLARRHLPRRIKSAFKTLNVRRRLLTVFQNSETLYWKLAAQGIAHCVDVMALGRDRFCVVNAAPWVKLQSYLDWVEAGRPSDDALDESIAPTLHETAHQRLNCLAEALDLTVPSDGDFTIKTTEDLGFLDDLKSSALSRQEARAVKYHVLGNRNAFIPKNRLLYLASTSTNSVNEGAAVLAHALLSRTRTLFHDPKAHFFQLLMCSAIAYFGSKALNHKRKCDMEDDFRISMQRRLGRRALPQERRQREIAKAVLRHCAAQREFLRGGRYRAPSATSGPSRVPVFLETARGLGAMLGEKLYAAFVSGDYDLLKIERLYSTKLDSAAAARAIYLKLLRDLEATPRSHTSKLDLF